MTAAETRRLVHDRVPAPPGESHGAGVCIICASRTTMHVSRTCSGCGCWLSDIDAAAVRPGDLVLDGPIWVTVAAVARYRTRVILDLGYRRWHTPADGRITVAVNQRHQEAA